MSRVVRPQHTVAISKQQPAGLVEGLAHASPDVEQKDTGDDYLNRVAKYVPAEVLGFFLFVNNILQEATKSSGAKPAVMAGYFSVSLIAWLAVILGTILAPLYIWYVHEEGDGWKSHAAVSCIAFPVWAYAIGAIAFAGHLDGNFASILLATFTAISGLVRPPAGTAPDVPKAVANAAQDEHQPNPSGPHSAGAAPGIVG